MIHDCCCRQELVLTSTEINRMMTSMMQMHQESLEFMHSQTLAMQDRQSALQLTIQDQVAAQQATNEQFMTSLQGLVSAQSRSQSKKMSVTPFDGTSENAESWLILYERTCDQNSWTDDKSRINNMKNCFKANSQSDRWFNMPRCNMG